LSVVWNLRAGLFFLLVAGSVRPDFAQAQINSWSSLSSGKWETGANWSLGIPPNLTHSVIIGNGVAGPPLFKFITIDATTTATLPINNMIVTDLRLGGGIVNNILNLNNAGLATPLFVLASLNISNNGTLLMSNSAINIKGSPFPTDGIVVDGSIVINSGEFAFTNIVATGMMIGKLGRGTVYLKDGLMNFTPATFIKIGSEAGAEGTLTLAGGIAELSSQFIDVGSAAGSTGTLWQTGCELHTFDVYIGRNGAGMMIVSNGTWTSIGNGVVVGQGSGSKGTLVLAGGTNKISNTFTVGSLIGSTGQVWMTGGVLIITNGSVTVGSQGEAHMTVSNGSWLAKNVNVGFSSPASTLTIAGGTSAFYSTMQIGKTGTVLITGGQLLVTNNLSSVGGGGTLILSNGVLQTAGVFVSGSLRIVSGTHFIGDLGLASGVSSVLGSSGTGQVQVTGGQLLALNSTNVVGQFGGGSMTQLNGFVQFASEIVGASSKGSLTVAGGTHAIGDGGILVGEGKDADGIMVIKSGTTMASRMVIGDCRSNAIGLVQIQGGEFFVTNAAHNAVLDVNNGTLLFISGHLTVDRLVMTNSCGLFVQAGGILDIDTLVLDPNLDADGDGLPNGWEQSYGLDPLASGGVEGPDGDLDQDGFTNLEEFIRGSNPLTSEPYITAYTKEGNNIRITWEALSGKTNMLQSANSSAGGGSDFFQFTDLPPQIVVVGSGLSITSRLVMNGATNNPARYFRVRQLP